MKKWRTLYTHSRQLPNSSSVIRKNICHHDHDHHAHNHHMNQSMTLQNVSSLYSKFREFGEDQDAVSFNQNIHRKMGWFYLLYTKGEEAPPYTLIFTVYTRNLRWNGIQKNGRNFVCVGPIGVSIYSFSRRDSRVSIPVRFVQFRWIVEDKWAIRNGAYIDSTLFHWTTGDHNDLIFQIANVRCKDLVVARCVLIGDNWEYRHFHAEHRGFRMVLDF